MRDDFKIVKKKRGTYYEFGVKGIDALEEDLYRMAEEARSELGQKVVAAAMYPVKARVASNLRKESIYDTGAIQDSLRMGAYHESKKERVRADVRVGTDKRGKYKRSGKRKPAYALQVEYGSKNSAFGEQPARPFMRPAFDGHERGIAEHLRRLLSSKLIQWRRTNKD